MPQIASLLAEVKASNPNPPLAQLDARRVVHKPGDALVGSSLPQAALEALRFSTGIVTLSKTLSHPTAIDLANRDACIRVCLARIADSFAKVSE